jgi:branched-chain amino acid transport system ATP-binding protein
MTHPDVLALEDVTKRFGSLAAVDEVTMHVPVGGCRALIGPNGAGKSTLFNLVSGRIRPSGGRILFDGRDVTGLSEDRRNRMGMATTFQHSNLFDGLSVRRNLELAMQRRLGLGARVWAGRRRQAELRQRTEQQLEQTGLGPLAERRAGLLAHGQRRRLEIALAVCTDPRLLLLDEPAAGMSAAECEELIELIRSLSERTVVLIEHNIDLVLEVATTISVLDAGRLVMEGGPSEVSGSKIVQEAYLGAGR